MSKSRKSKKEKKRKRDRERERKPPHATTSFASQGTPPQHANPRTPDTASGKDEPKLTPRGEYTLFEHPRKCFQVEYPSAWEFTMEDDTRSVMFSSKEVKTLKMCFYIMPYFVDTAMLIASPHVEEACTQMLIKSEAINPRRDSLIPYYNMKGDRNQKDRGVDGNLYFVLGCDIILLATTLFPLGQDHEWNPLFERLLSSFRIPRETEALMSRACFRLLDKLKTKYPDEKFEHDGHEIRGRGHANQLGNLMARINQNPRNWERIVDEYFDAIVAMDNTKGLGAEKFEDYREKIFPFIRPESFLSANKLPSEQSRVVATDWLGNLKVTYVLNIPKAFRYITQYDLERWGVTREEIHELAIKNLVSKDDAGKLPQMEPGVLPFLMISTGDNMEASRLLGPDLYKTFAEMMKGPFLAAIPCRDALILFPNHQELRRDIQPQVRKDFESSAYPISDRLFLVTADGVTFAEW